MKNTNIYAAIGHWKDSKDICSIVSTQATKKDFMRDCYGNGFVPYVVLTEAIIEKIFNGENDGMEIFEQVKKMTSNHRVWNPVTDYIKEAGYLITEKVNENKNNKNTEENTMNATTKATAANVPAASRKEDLIRQRDEWDARNAEQKARHEAQYAEFRSKRNEIYNGVKEQVLAALSGVSLNLEIDVDAGLSMKPRGVEVCVRSNENNIHAENKALSWTWKVSLGESNSVKKESSSWSGLQATTAEQMESLRQTVKALEILNEIDWAALLAVTLPDWSEYLTEDSSIGTRPNFEADIRAAELAELIGTNTLVKGLPIDRYRYGHSEAWYLIVSETPKQFKVVELAGYSIKEEYLTQRGQTLAEAVEQAKNWTTAISKEKFLNDVLKKEIEMLAF